MKNKMIILLSIILLFSLVFTGCGSDNVDDIDYDSSTTTQENLTEEKDDEPEIEEIDLTIKYQKISDGKAEVIGFSGEGNTADIDSEYEGCDVVRIADSAFENCESLVKVYMWADIEEYGDNCFRNCTSLKEIDISSEAERIGKHAFDGCTSLTEVYVWGDPEIDEYAFANCTALKDFDIPSDTKTVGNYAFENCTSLSTLYIWGGEVIGDYAFAGCTSLKEVDFSSDIKKVGSHAFDGCTALEEVMSWNDDIEYGVNVFVNCPNLKDKPVADSVEETTTKPTTEKETTTKENQDEEEEEVILNKDNCPALAYILTTKDEFDPKIKEFADRYYGEKIEFDGCTLSVSRHGNYTTRFDYLIGCGDYNPNSAIGPYFQFYDVAYYDLHLTGSDVPDTFGTGLNIHVIAEVGEYDEYTGLFEIDPVKITMR